MRSRSPTDQDVLLLLFLPTVVALLLISPIFFSSGVGAFDANDDSIHTFPSLKIAYDILREGAIPWINVYNNFGTELLGDSLTLPFAPHALTYWFYPPSTAMGINRFLAAFSTLLVAQLFFRRFITPGLAFLSGMATLFQPGFLWHYAHHQYQFTLFYTLLLLLLLEKIAKSPGRGRLGCFFAMAAVLCVSVSANLVVIVFAFLALEVLFFQRLSHRLKLTLLSLISAAVLVTSVQHLALLHAAGQSLRIASSYGSRLSFEQIRIALLLPSDFASDLIHVGFTLFLSFPVVLYLLYGALKEKGPLKQKCVLLGVLPWGLVCMGLIFPALVDWVPLLKSTDITRVLWVGNIYVSLLLALGVRAFLRSAASSRSFLLILLLLLALLIELVISASPQVLSFARYYLIYLLGLLLLFMLFHPVSNRARWSEHSLLRMKQVLSTLCIPCGPMVFLIYFLGFSPPVNYSVPFIPGTHWFSSEFYSGFQPPDFLSRISPGSRIAVNMPTPHGQDMKAAVHGIFGTAAKATFMNQKIYRHLDSLGLVKPVVAGGVITLYAIQGDWEPELFASLGVQFVISPDWRMPGWRYVAAAPYMEWASHLRELHLLANPLETSLVSMDGAALDGASFSVIANGVRVILPEIASESRLKVRLTQFDGWRAHVDGREVSLIEDENDPFLTLAVQPGDAIAEVQFQPLSGFIGPVSFIAGWLLVLVALLLSPRTHLPPLRDENV